MEVQITDMENAAFAVMIVLVTRVILAFDLNLYIPLSKVDENMARAHARDAISSQKFWFRKVSDWNALDPDYEQTINQQSTINNRQPPTNDAIVISSASSTRSSRVTFLPDHHPQEHCAAATGRLRGEGRARPDGCGGQGGRAR